MKIFFFMLSFLVVTNAKADYSITDLSKESLIEHAEKAKDWPHRVYLATYPRSGNHWMRYLIEEATHIATSSVHCDGDPPHLQLIFPWGGFCCLNGYEGICRYPMLSDIVVIKTHYPSIESPFNQLPYKNVIRIIRHPIDSFYSCFMCTKIAHQLPIDYVITEDAVLKYIHDWRAFQEYWEQAENVFTIRYEDLYQNPVFYLGLVLEKIGYTLSVEDIQRAVQKYPPVGGCLKYLPHFTEKSLTLIQNELGEFMQQYGYESKSFIKADQ
jgi:hypothetical protein